MKIAGYIICFCLSVFYFQKSTAQNISATRSEEANLWKQLKKESGFKKVFKKFKKYRFEIIYTEIDRGLNGEIRFKRYHLGDSLSYFYPASTVKLPLAIAISEMIQKAPFYNVNGSMKLKLDTTAYCHHQYDNGHYEYYRIQKKDTWKSIAQKFRITMSDFIRWNQLDTARIPKENTSVKIYHRKVRPSIQDLISSMLVYSDNESYNKLFEMGGGHAYTNWLKGYGFSESNITRKFLFCEGEDKSVSVSYDILNDRDVIIYHGNEQNWLPASNRNVSGIKVGQKYYWKDSLVPTPRDFSDHNRIPLADLDQILKRLIFPEAFAPDQIFKINENTRKFLIRKLGNYPREHQQPLDSIYDGWEDGRNVFIFNGEDTTQIESKFRWVNIIGQAYGFSTDCMYFTDDETKSEFFLSVRIYTNKNEILGDDKYEYHEIAMPLMKFLGEYFYHHEKNRKKEVLPNFALFRHIFD